MNIGARFTPCIRPVPSFPSSTLISDCYKSSTDTCTVEALCGYGGFPDDIPNQSFRLILPIFMHAGIVHFLMNMLTHLRLGVDLERALGTPRYVLLYMASGIYGFVLSAMLSQNMSASTGCSGALFGLIGYMFIDIMVNWKFLPYPMRDLMGLLVSTIISLVLGLLPGLDNFAHIGKTVISGLTFKYNIHIRWFCCWYTYGNGCCTNAPNGHTWSKDNDMDYACCGFVWVGSLICCLYT